MRFASVIFVLLFFCFWIAAFIEAKTITSPSISFEGWHEVYDEYMLKYGYSEEDNVISKYDLPVFEIYDCEILKSERCMSYIGPNDAEISYLHDFDQAEEYAKKEYINDIFSH